MTTTSVYVLFPSRNKLAREAVLQGLNLAFGSVDVVEAEGVDEVLFKEPAKGREFMVLIEPTMPEIELAVKSGIEEGLARWPLVSLSSAVHSTGMEVIPAEDWHGPLLSQVFRAALQKDELVRENARLRGDLWTMARRISHDLRTPLSGIFTTAELLKEILSEQSEEDAALTEPLVDSTQAVLKLIERVNQLTRASLETKLKELVDMEQVAWAGRQGAERTAMKQGITIKEPAEWPSVYGVSAWLEVIWENLLMNAVTYSGKGRTVEIQWRELNDEFEFSVVDDGPGVAPAKVPNLFTPFEKLHQSHSVRGLGLSIVRRLVELQGGRCGYAADEGGGARFYFTLPKQASSTAVAT
jgi:signal transduction histidine kinase